MQSSRDLSAQWTGPRQLSLVPLGAVAQLDSANTDYGVLCGRQRTILPVEVSLGRACCTWVGHPHNLRVNRLPIPLIKKALLVTTCPTQQLVVSGLTCTV